MSETIDLDPAVAPEEKVGLPRRAKLFLVSVAVATAAATLPAFANLSPETEGWVTFGVLASAAAIAQLFVVKTPKNQSYHLSIVFAVAAALVLPPELVALVGFVCHVPEWLKLRYPWFIQSFNICNYTLNTLAAWGVATLVHQLPGLGGDLGFAIGGIMAAAVFVGMNHLLLSTMLLLGRGHSFRRSGLFGAESLSTDFVLAVLGAGVAGFWLDNPWLVVTVIAPLVLIQRALSVPVLREQARVDAKTGLFNAKHFASFLNEELARSQRFNRPMSVVMADLDLLRDINNTYGHLAGDAVLQGIAEIFRIQMRQYDVPARFGGEEFAIILPETPIEHAIEIAERIRLAVAEAHFEVDTSSEPIRATVSLGVAAFPKDATDATALVHQADLAVYRAKLQGRNRVVAASADAELIALPNAPRKPHLVAVGEASARDETPAAAPGPAPTVAATTEKRHPRPHAATGPWFLNFSGRLGALVICVSLIGIAVAAAGMVFGTSTDVLGLIAIVVLVGIAQVLAVEFDEGSVSVSAVGALAGAALFGPRAALPLAITSAAVAWSALRLPLHQVLYNIGALSLASLGASAIFALASLDILFSHGFAGDVALVASGLIAGIVYFVVNTGLISLAMAIEGHKSWWNEWRERWAWLLLHYVAYGFVGGVIAIAYGTAEGPARLLALAVFALPLLLMRKTQAAYLRHTQRSAHKLREAADTIQSQNVSLEEANKALRERSTAAMESLAATVDARDAYTAGHSRRVQRLALAIGRELNLSQAELDVLGHAALFHDIGKLAIPDAVLLKPGKLTSEEWTLMKRHAEEGARIIERLGFLEDAVPAIRHHHERWDGTGYPVGISGEAIPLGARIIHVADAFDSMLTTRIYRAALPLETALEELRNNSGTQFCARCVSALERILPDGEQDEHDSLELVAS